MVPIILSSERLTIKPYRKIDEEKYIEMMMDASSAEFMGGATGIESEEREVFNKIFRIYRDNDERIFWIWGIYKEEELCGHLELKETEYTDEDELEIVYMVHPNFRRMGVISEILSLIKKNGKIWKRKIIATIDPDNILSKKVLEKWGIAKQELIIEEETNEEFLKLSLTY